MRKIRGRGRTFSPAPPSPPSPLPHFSPFFASCSLVRSLRLEKERKRLNVQATIIIKKYSCHICPVNFLKNLTTEERVMKSSFGVDHQEISLVSENDLPAFLTRLRVIEMEGKITEFLNALLSNQS